MQVKESVCCGYSSAFDFDITLAGMLRAPLIGHEVVQMGEPAQKCRLAPFGMMEALHHAQLGVPGATTGKCTLREYRATTRYTLRCENSDLES